VQIKAGAAEVARRRHNNDYIGKSPIILDYVIT